MSEKTAQNVSSSRYVFLLHSVLTRKEELAAVMVPCGLINAAFSSLIFSNVLTLIPLSFVRVTALPVQQQVRLVSAKAERPNHPWGEGVPSQGGVSQPGGGGLHTNSDMTP